MKASLLIGAITVCLLWGCHGYEPSLYQAERLQTAEKLLWSVPYGMQKGIEQRLVHHADKTDNERERFCVQYLLYQLQMIAKKETTTATSNMHTPWLISKAHHPPKWMALIYPSGLSPFDIKVFINL